MWEDATEGITEAWMLKDKDEIEPGELHLLRNRIWMSWSLWLLAVGALTAVMSGVLLDWSLSIFTGAFIAFQLTRIIRSYRRPTWGMWHVRKHFYKLSYLLPWIIVPIFTSAGDHSSDVIGWVAYLFSLSFLYHIQVKDDLKILRAIPSIIQRLKNRANS